MKQDFFQFDHKITQAAQSALRLCAHQLQQTEEIQEYNQQKMLYAFQKAGVSESHFTASTGYGYGDRGRDALDVVFAAAFDAQDALVRHNFVSGTHALTVALFGLLRPGDTMLCVTGTPYDTLLGVIGIQQEKQSVNTGTLRDFGIKYQQTQLKADGTVDLNAMKAALQKDTKMVYIQRSRGYSLRPSLLTQEIAQIAKEAKKIAPGCIVMLDNCYGEFVEKEQPLANGVDIMAGSLIKNPGGGIAPTGGYIAGRKDLVEMCACRLTTPSTGKEIGATLGNNRSLFMGAFHAPHITGEAVKTAIFAAALFETLGFEVTPRYNESRADIIQVLLLKNSQALTAFCRGIQRGAPVDAFVVPEAWDMPGYDSQVIMAAGTFTLGASIELSADAPLREPYAAWLQGALNFHSGKLGVMLAAQSMLENGFIK